MNTNKTLGIILGLIGGMIVGFYGNGICIFGLIIALIGLTVALESHN